MSDYRNTLVRVKNETGVKLISVSVAHKYSDKYKDLLEFKTPINNGGVSDHRQAVQYDIGTFELGRDWWFVTWVDEYGRVYKTDPNNFRGLMDFFEKAATEAIKAFESVELLMAMINPHPASKVVHAASVVVTFVLSKYLLNSEGTAGFKQFILRDEDTRSGFEIVIRPNEVVFWAESGSTSTNVKALGTLRDRN